MSDGISIKSIPHPKNTSDMAEKIIRLMEENENLLERINNLQEIVREDTEELLQYRAENEKLREECAKIYVQLTDDKDDKIKQIVNAIKSVKSDNK